MFFILLIVPVTFFGQSIEPVTAFLNSIPDNLGRPVSLPERNHGLPVSWDNYERRQYVYIITSDSVYRQVFSQYRFTKDSLSGYIWDNDSSLYKYMLRYHLIDSLPVFDFSKEELVLYSACGYCSAYCNHHGKKHEPCHRGACDFMDAWFVREKQPAITQRNRTPD